MSGENQDSGQVTAREPLTRQRVLEAALQIIDREGLDALSMRRLGTELGVDPMAVYRHVEGKDAVLDGVAELLWTKLPESEQHALGWADGLRAFARSLRSVFHRHPNAAPLLLQRPVLPIPSLEKSYEQLSALRQAGFEPSAAAEVVRTVTSFSTGYGLAEITCIGIVGPDDFRMESDRDVLVTFAQYLPPGTPARLVDVAIALWAGADAESSFESGLDLILAGARAALEKSADIEA